MSGKAAKRRRRTESGAGFAVLRGALDRLMAIFKRRAPALYEALPDCRRPCHTCAFAPSQRDVKGWDSTTLDLVAALDRGLPFWCHEPLEKLPRGAGWKWAPEHAVVCAGWAVVVPDPEARLVFWRASVANGDAIPRETAEREWRALAPHLEAIMAKRVGQPMGLTAADWPRPEWNPR